MSFGRRALVDLLAEPVDDDVHDVGAGVEVVVPHVLGDEGAAHHPAEVADQVGEDGVLLRRQLDGLAGAGHLAAAGVDAQVRHLDDGRRELLGPAADRLDAGEELGHRERLGDVVVGASAARPP